jgi:hypothetical protein
VLTPLISDSDSSNNENVIGTLLLSKSLTVSSDSAWGTDNITADAELTITSDSDLTAGTLNLTGSADLSLGTDNITLNVTNAATLENSQKLQNGSGSFNFIGGLSLESGSEIIAQGQQISGNVELNGGKITNKENTKFPDDLTHVADSTIHIDASKTLTYGGSEIDLGAYTFNFR